MLPFKTHFPPKFLETYQFGTLNYTYKGLKCLQNPIDMAIFLHLLPIERPKTIFEIGTNAGGSAILFRDFASLFGLDTQVISIDVIKPIVESEHNVVFIEGDAENLEQLFIEHDLFARPRPWLAIEDSAHTYDVCIAVLNFFAETLRSGELLIMEDGVLDDLGLSEGYDGGPNRAISEFFRSNPHVFEIQRQYCDMFGPNATYNPNGYLRKI